MVVLRYADAVVTAESSIVAAYGGFESLHRGHESVLRALRAHADREAAHALVVQVGARSRRAGAGRLASDRQRVRRMGELGVDTLLLSRSACADVDWQLLQRLGVATLVTADSPSPTAKVRVVGVDIVQYEGTRIGDEGVRRAVREVDFDELRALLGRSYSVDGRVVHGFHRGGPLGVPTANLRISDQLLPPDGVYAVRARILGKEYGGVANIGYKPTFGDRERSLETHLLDFVGDIYGRRLEVYFQHRIRAEQKFASVEDLLAQIQRDIAATRQMLTEP